MIVDYHMHLRDPDGAIDHLVAGVEDGEAIPWNWGDVARGLDGVCLEVSSAGLHKPHGESVSVFEGRRRRQEPLG